LAEESSLRESMAFKEYSTGERSKIKHPWVTITISGILVAGAMVLTNWLGTALHGNPYSFNFILALYGIPAGFACAWRNKTLSAFTSLRYSTFSALIATASYFLITLIALFASPLNAIGMISSIGQLAVASAIIAVFFICVTFASGAMIGTIVLGVRDSKS
jgi:hypothetical protein